MNPEQPSREQIEARLTALLLGELPAAEAELLRFTISQDPELQKLHDQLKLTVGFVREAMKNPTGAPVDRETPLKLAQERRQTLLAHFKSARPQPPQPPEELFWLRRIKIPSGRSIAVTALVALVICGLIAIAIPNFVQKRSTSQVNACINNLRQIDAAKNEWALENHKSADAVPTVNDLSPYLEGGTIRSVAGENYVLGKVSEPTVAEINGKRLVPPEDMFFSFDTGQSPTHSAREPRSMNEWAMESRQASSPPDSLAINSQESKVPPQQVQPAPIALPKTESSQAESEQNSTGVYSENVVGYVNIGRPSSGREASTFTSGRGNPTPSDSAQTISTTPPTTPPQLAGREIPSAPAGGGYALLGPREGPTWSTFDGTTNTVGVIQSFGGAGGSGGGTVPINHFIARNDFIATNAIAMNQAQFNFYRNIDRDQSSEPLITRESPNANSVDENGMKNGLVENPNANTPIINPETGLPANAPAAPTPVIAPPPADAADLSAVTTMGLASQPQQPNPPTAPAMGKEQERIRTIHETPESTHQADEPSTVPANSPNGEFEQLRQMQIAPKSPVPVPSAGVENGIVENPNAQTRTSWFTSRMESAAALPAANTPTEQIEPPPLITRESQNANSIAENTDQMQIGSLSDAEAASDIEKLKKERQEEEAQIQMTLAPLPAGTGKAADLARVGLPPRSPQYAQRLVTVEHAYAKPPPANVPIPQPEIQTSDNAFSTFSMNVSDVSFKLALASLQKGQMPDPASIRSEEFINAFDYHDPEPLQGEPLAFMSERAGDPFAHERDLLRFSIKAAAAGRQGGRALNIVLLIDTSGSMERADRVAIVREALRVLASQLQPQDVVSVVSFARTARLWADGVPGDEAGATLDKVGSITPEGGTNLEEAMRLAYETALRHFIAGGINCVVLLTDGAANLGNVDPQALTQKVDSERRQGIALDCFGIGWDDYNDDLLEKLSSNGDGRYAFINSPDEAATEFAAKLAGALQVAAEDVKVQVEFNPNRVTAWRQIGYAKHQLTKEQFRDNSVAAGAIAAREAGNALYVIEANPDGQGPIATVRVRYRVPGTQEVYERSWLVDYTGPAPDLAQSSPPMRLCVTAAEISEWMADSPFAQDVTPDDLLNYLSDVPQYYGTDERPKQLEWMIREAKSVSGK